MIWFVFTFGVWVGCGPILFFGFLLFKESKKNKYPLFPNQMKVRISAYLRGHTPNDSFYDGSNT